MATAQDFVDEYTDLLAQRVAETPPGSNCNWITRWFGFCGAWCAMTASYVLWKIGIKGFRSAAARGLAEQFRAKGLFFYGQRNIPVGALVFFDWSGRGDFDNIHHVEGCVGSDADGWPLDIGANVSDTMVRQYRRSCVVGWALPPYDQTVPKLTQAQLALIWIGTLAKTKDWAGVALAYQPGEKVTEHHLHKVHQVKQLLHMWKPGIYANEDFGGEYDARLREHVLKFQQDWNAFHPLVKIRKTDGLVRRRTVRALLFVALTRGRR